jgi:acyl carrier protein
MPANKKTPPSKLRRPAPQVNIGNIHAKIRELVLYELCFAEEEVNDDTKIWEMADSIDYCCMSLAIEDEFEIDIEEADWFKAPDLTLKGLVERVANIVNTKKRKA